MISNSSEKKRELIIKNHNANMSTTDDSPIKAKNLTTEDGGYPSLHDEESPIPLLNADG